MNRVGEVLDGKYQIVRLLGAGGMGEVYSARHMRIGKDVAIKFLHRTLAYDDEVVARFSQEARAAAAIGHRGIVDIYDIGTAQDGAPYLVMELLDGESLRAVMARAGPLPAGLACSVVASLLAPLVAAHSKGVVHRDLKPDNIFLERSDGPLSVKLLDFGIAKMTEGAVVQATKSGFAMGTPAYMPPEQVRGVRDLDARVDIYAAGVILYEALTGRLPFDAANYNLLMVQILTEEAPRPSRFRSDLPADIEAIVVRAMARDRDQRFQSASDLLTALHPHERAVDSRRIVVPSRAATPIPAMDSTASIPASEVAAGAALDTPTSSRRSGRLRSLVVFAGTPLVIVAGVIVGFVVSSARDASRSPAQEVPTTPVPLTPPPGPPGGGAPTSLSFPQPPQSNRVVTIEVDGLPVGARLHLGGVLVTELPIRRASSTSAVELRVDADGFETYTRMIVPANDQTTTVSLVPLLPRAKTHRGTSPPRPSTARDGAAVPGPRRPRFLTDESEFEENP